MAIGKSGRIVLEIDPELKRRIYSALALQDASLKDWFLSKVDELIVPPDVKNSDKNKGK